MSNEPFIPKSIATFEEHEPHLMDHFVRHAERVNSYNFDLDIDGKLYNATPVINAYYRTTQKKLRFMEVRLSASEGYGKAMAEGYDRVLLKWKQSQSLAAILTGYSIAMSILFVLSLTLNAGGF